MSFVKCMHAIQYTAVIGATLLIAFAVCSVFEGTAQTSYQLIISIYQINKRIKDSVDLWACDLGTCTDQIFSDSENYNWVNIIHLISMRHYAQDCFLFSWVKYYLTNKERERVLATIVCYRDNHINMPRCLRKCT